MATRHDAVIIGSGPNGLAAAIYLSSEGFKVLVVEAAATLGGGARTAELTLPGFAHDICSAIHPLGVGSPYLRTLPLEQHGLTWLHPEAPVGHPLDDEGALIERSLEATCAALGEDGEAWERMARPLVAHWDGLSETLLRPIVAVPKVPFTMMRFGLGAIRSAAGFARAHFRTPKARALFMGLAAHSLSDLDKDLSAAIGLVFVAAAHAVGWPAPKGGSQKLVDAMVSLAREKGCEFRTGMRVRKLSDLPDCDAVLFDTRASAMARIAGDALPPSFRAKLEAIPRGPGIFKIDYALDGPMPWKDPRMLRAGTLHLGGTLEEMVTAEKDAIEGRVPERPMCLVAQQSMFDATRAPPGKHTLWVYAHVPNGCREDMTSRIEAQLERFAPGFRARVLAQAKRSPQDLEAYNENYEGGDIAAGSVAGLRAVFRPRFAIHPYATPNPRLWLCSASTPPGPGVHGMCGFHAARLVARSLARRKRISPLPSGEG